MILEHQPALLDLSSPQDGIPWNSVTQISEESALETIRSDAQASSIIRVKSSEPRNRTTVGPVPDHKAISAATQDIKKAAMP